MAINFNKKTVIKRCIKALGFVAAYTSSEVDSSPQGIPKKVIDHHFGPSKELNSWLRSQLLICVDNHYNKDTGKVKQYLRNELGCRELCKRYGIVFDTKLIGLSFTDQQYGDMIAKNQIYYKTGKKSGRRINSIQQIKSLTRASLFAAYGFINNYDIESAALTLLYQHSRICLTRSMTNPHITAKEQKLLIGLRSLDYILFAITDKQQLRETLSLRLDIKIKDIKQILTSMVAGGSTLKGYSAYNILKKDKVKLAAFNADPFIIEFKKDLIDLWKPIKVVDKIKLNAKEKWGVYYHLERTVMNSVYNLIDPNRRRLVDEHDGFRVKEEIDIPALIAHVYKQTGYKVDFSHEVVPVYKDKKEIKGMTNTLKNKYL